MKNQPSIYTKLSNRYNLPYHVIEVICNSPFRFANEAITNMEDKAIRFTYLGKIKLKKQYEKKKLTNTILQFILDYFGLLLKLQIQIRCLYSVI